jgi:hypothetical protein
MTRRDTPRRFRNFDTCLSTTPHISPGEPFDLKKRLFLYELAMIQARTQNDSVFYPVIGTIWPAHLGDTSQTIATARLFRAITQPAWPYRPKIPDSGEICGLQATARRSGPLSDQKQVTAQTADQLA